MLNRRSLATKLHNFRLRWSGILSGERAKYPAPPHPIGIFTHHKTGTVLLAKVFGDLCTWFGWSGSTAWGQSSEWPAESNVRHFLHSETNPNQFPQPYRGIHVVRHPVTLLLSSYHYHLRTDEEWCTNENFHEEAPIGYPQVPANRTHCHEAWKIKYLHGLNGVSYQRNLHQLNRTDGISFELERHTKFTLEGMRDWQPDPSRVKEMKFEEFAHHFDATFREVFLHLEFPPPLLKRALRLAQHHDLSRASRSQLARNSHYTGADNPSRRKDLTPQHLARLEEIAPGLSDNLGYNRVHGGT